MVYQCEKNILISWKKAQKVDFWKFLDPFSWLPFGTKNHEIWGPSDCFMIIEPLKTLETLPKSEDNK